MLYTHLERALSRYESAVQRRQSHYVKLRAYVTSFNASNSTTGLPVEIKSRIMRRMSSANRAYVRYDRIVTARLSEVIAEAQAEGWREGHLSRLYTR